MDNQVFSQPGPTTLIPPRRLSLNGNHDRGHQRHYISTLGTNDLIFPEATPTDNAVKTYYSGGAGLAQEDQRERPVRRHSVSTIPPRHAIHMPVMKIDPSLWRKEQHQREIYRLLHEDREEGWMKRRGVKNVMDTMEEEPEDASEAMTGVVVNADTGGFRSLSDEREKELIRQQVRQEWAKLVEEQTKEYEMMLQQAAAASAAKAQERELVRRNSWPRQLGQQQVQLKMPSQVLHPTMTSMDPLQQQVQMPFQPPAPGQQQDQHVASMMGPLSNPNAWSAAPLYALNTRRPSFTEYRG